MATMIAAFSGKNRDFKAYLEEQRTIELRRAMQALQNSIVAVKAAIPCEVTVNLQGPIQVYLKGGPATIEHVPGPVTATELSDADQFYKYRLNKHWEGADFIAWAKEHEVQPAGTEFIRKMIQEVAGNEN